MNIIFRIIIRFLNRNNSLRIRLNKIEGRVFEFYIKEFKKKFYMTIENGYLKPLNHINKDADVVVKGKIMEFIGMIFNRSDSDSSLFRGAMEIEGDIESLLYLKNAMGNISIWKSLIL
jgi:predicted lipid carrier protein YhbT